jgi:ribosome biogenesis GTPase
MRNKSNNLYDRQQNKRAKVKKERAKVRHFDGERSVAPNFEEKDGAVAIISSFKSFDMFDVYREDVFLEAKLSKKAPAYLARQLVIGDRVLLSDRNEVVGLLPRHSYLARLRGDSSRSSPHAFSEHVIAANVDTAVIVVSVKSPAFQSRLVDRYLILCQYGNVEPLICLNKCDLSSERPDVLNWYKKIGIKVIETSADGGFGLEVLRESIGDKTVVFVGSSGVGKSSLINRINPDLHLRTQEISKKGDQGKHTTTSSNLYRLNRATLLMDTPGIRSLGISGIRTEDLRYYFKEFKPYEGLCKYGDCRHALEDGCAVKEALGDAMIPKERYESYLRLLMDKD